MLSFFEQFRKIYVGDQVQKTSKVYRKLSEVLGLQDESMVTDVAFVFFVRDGILSVADYNSTRVGVVVVVVVVNFFAMG